MADLESAIQHLLKAKRISAPSQSYRKDNPAEYAKVEAYLKGGARPTGISTEMGLGLVEVEDVNRAVIPPDPPDPPDPPPTDPQPPITITQGGTYRGYWRSTSTAPAVTISTSQPVIIEDSVIERTTTGAADHLLVSSATGAQVTVRRTQLIGPAGGYGRCIRGENFKLFVVENCTITRTGGIYLLLAAPATTILVRRNRMTNVQGGAQGSERQFLQMNQIQGATSIIAEWNEVKNTFGQSYSEDVFSVFNTSNAVIRNNYVEGGYPFTADMIHRGTGILLADVGGNNNVAHDNQIIGVTNVGIGIVAGQNNRIYNNRVVSDGKLPNGTPLASANNGIVVYDAYGTAMANNTVDGNHIGYMHAGSPMYRNDYWCPAASNNVEADNSFYYDNHSTPITKADEEAEWPIWQKKLADNGITIGA